MRAPGSAGFAATAASAIALLAVAMGLVAAVVTLYAFYVAATHGGVVDQQRMNVFGRAVGQMLGPVAAKTLTHELLSRGTRFPAAA